MLARYDFALAGAPHRWGDYAAGEKIDHADAMTLEEAEHQIATRLYQNTAKVHFNLHEQAQGQFKRRLVYGGVVISLARALSFNGLANAFHIAAINGGRHVAPCFAGDTVYAWSEVLETAEIPGRSDIGALRTRLVAVKNRSCADFPLRNAKGDYADGVILDLDLWLVLPRLIRQTKVAAAPGIQYAGDAAGFSPQLIHFAQLSRMLQRAKSRGPSTAAQRSQHGRGQTDSRASALPAPVDLRPLINMVMSILHRLTGAALYFGTLLLAAWLIAAAMGEAPVRPRQRACSRTRSASSSCSATPGRSPITCSAACGT